MSDYKYTIQQIKKLNEEAGYTFFGAQEENFFGSTTLFKVYAGGYFITKERMDETRPYRYTVRRFIEETALIETVGDFNEFEDEKAARRRARALAELHDTEFAHV